MFGARAMLSGHSTLLIASVAFVSTAATMARDAYADSVVTQEAVVANAAKPADVAPLVSPKHGLETVPDSAPVYAGDSYAAKMSSVERINIRVPGVVSLSGEYRINGDGTIALPGIGRLNVGESTISGFETQLASEIQRVSNRESSVAVEVIDYRPVFVSGVVARSGSFPWKPGFSILHVEALAGGLYRGPVSADASAAAEPTTDREQERAMRSAYGLASTLASIERLKTEMRNEATYVLPPRAVSLVSKSDQQTLLSAQQATLASRLSMFNAKITAAENAKAMAAKEKSALEDQIVRIKKQLNQRRELTQKIEYMTQRRYARGERLFEEQVRVAELEERLTTTTIAISRTEVAANMAQQELESIVLSRNAEIDTELLSLEQKKVGFEIDIDSANNIYRRVTGRDVNTARFAEPLVPRYEIVRTEAGKTQVLKADRSVQVLPGDVVVVSFGRTDGS